MFEDYWREYGSGGEYVLIDRAIGARAFPSVDEIQAHINNGKMVVFLISLLIRSAKEVLLGDRPTARDSERALASLFDILQADSSSMHYQVAFVWARIDMASTCHSSGTYLVSRWPSIEMRIHMR